MNATITVLILLVTGIILYRYYMRPKSTISQNVITKINYPSAEILELIGDDKFNSLLFNDRGVFIVRKGEE